MPPASTSSARALAAILPQIEAGQAYEAHQKARTFASRYAKSAQYDTAIDVLFQSARELLKAGQQGSGTDLGVFLLDVYESKGETVNDESRGRITQLIALTGSAGTWRKTMIDKSVAWSAKHGPWPAGDQDLHHYVGELFYKEGAYDLAEPHLLAAGKRDSARTLGRMMVEWAGADGAPGDFALRGTLPYLLNGNILGARAFVSAFVSSILATRPTLASPIQTTPLPVGEDEVTFTTDPNLNFVQLAVRTCQRANGATSKPAREAWIRLCGTYQSKSSALSQPEVRRVLSELAQFYFAIPLPRGQASNPLGDMMSAMFGGGPSGGASAPRVLTPAPAAVGLD